jgi:hypothetical protein
MVYGLVGPNGVGIVFTANQAITQSFTTNDGKIFYCTNIMFTATSPAVLFNIRYKNRNVFNTSVPLQTIAGTNGQFPVPVIPGLLVFGSSETVQTDFRDYSGAGNTLFVSYIGYEVDR